MSEFTCEFFRGTPGSAGQCQPEINLMEKDPSQQIDVTCSLRDQDHHTTGLNYNTLSATELAKTTCPMISMHAARRRGWVKPDAETVLR